jgi:hypothetical protein
VEQHNIVQKTDGKIFLSVGFSLRGESGFCIICTRKKLERPLFERTSLKGEQSDVQSFASG